MTLNEVLSYQKTYKAEHGSAAIGRYQFMDYTLKDMIQKYGIDPNATFSAEFQDRLAFLKLNER
jgi:muramidase (phage lysozyme)